MRRRISQVDEGGSEDAREEKSRGRESEREEIDALLAHFLCYCHIRFRFALCGAEYLESAPIGVFMAPGGLNSAAVRSIGKTPRKSLSELSRREINCAEGSKLLVFELLVLNSGI